MELLEENRNSATPEARQGMKSSYYNFLVKQIESTNKIKKNMMRSEPAIILSVYFLQVLVFPFIFLWFNGMHSREYDKKILHNMVAIEGRYKYPLKKWLQHVLIVIPTIALISLVTFLLQMNTWIAIDTAVQWPFVLFSLISTSLYALIIITLVSLVSLKTANLQQSWIYSIVFLFLILLATNSPLAFLTPAHYYYWIFHPNIWISIMQVFIYIVFFLIVFSGYLWEMKKKQNLY